MPHEVPAFAQLHHPGGALGEKAEQESFSVRRGDRRQGGYAGEYEGQQQGSQHEPSTHVHDMNPAAGAEAGQDPSYNRLATTCAAGSTSEISSL